MYCQQFKLSFDATQNVHCATSLTECVWQCFYFICGSFAIVGLHWYKIMKLDKSARARARVCVCMGGWVGGFVCVCVCTCVCVTVCAGGHIYEVWCVG